MAAHEWRAVHRPGGSVQFAPVLSQPTTERTARTLAGLYEDGWLERRAAPGPWQQVEIEQAAAEQAGLDPNDGNLRLWECAHILRLPGGNPDFRRCGFITRAVPDDEPGWCPYDHGEDRIRLVRLTAVALCCDCQIPVPLDDCRTADGRLICGGCAT